MLLEGTMDLIIVILQSIIIFQNMGPHAWIDNKVRELDSRAIVHYEFVPTGQRVNQVY